MSNLKKAIAVLLAAAMVFALAACGASPAAPAPAAAPAADTAAADEGGSDAGLDTSKVTNMERMFTQTGALASDGSQLPAEQQPLKSLDLSNVKEPVDMSFVSQLPNLRSLTLYGTTISNGAAVKALPETVKIYKDKTTQGL